MKPLQQYFHMVLFVFCAVLTFASMDEILWSDHSNETPSAVLSHGTICFLRCSNFLVYGWNPMMWPFKWNLSSCTFICYYLFCSSFQLLVGRWNPTVCHSNKTSSTVFSHGAICFVSSSKCWVRGWNPMVLPFTRNLFLGTFIWYYLFCTVKPNLTTTSVIQSPCYYGHFFSARQKGHTFCYIYIYFKIPNSKLF